MRPAISLALLVALAIRLETQQPWQYTGNLGLGVGYQIAFTKTTHTDPKAGAVPATHQLALYTSLDGAGVLTGTYFQPAPLTVP